MSVASRCSPLLLIVGCLAAATTQPSMGPSKGPSTGPSSGTTTAPSVFAASQPTVATSQPVAVFVSPVGRVRFSYPTDWKLPPKPLNGQLFSARTGPLDTRGRFAVFAVQLDRAPPGAPDRAALLDLSDALAAYAFNHGGQHVMIKPDSLGGADSTDAIPARLVRFTTASPTGKMATQYVVAVKNGTEYLLTLAGPAEIFDAAAAEMTVVLQTFQRLQ